MCVQAEDHMRKDIQVIIPYAVGSGMGQVFRVLQQYGSRQGINLIPVFKPGAESMIALNDATDGTYMYLCTSSSTWIRWAIETTW